MSTKYSIVSEFSPPNLEIAVNMKLADGWELHGSVSVIVLAHTTLYTQAMIYREKAKQ
jgi:hypothetical protein